MAKWQKQEKNHGKSCKTSKVKLTKEKPRFATLLFMKKMAEISKGKKSANTERSTSWAVTAFRQGLRNVMNPLQRTLALKMILISVLLMLSLGWIAGSLVLSLKLGGKMVNTNPLLHCRVYCREF